MNEKAEPTHLYHYTTAQGFKGIVESQQLWASDIFYLNDWKEFYHGREVLIGCIDRLLPDIDDTLERSIVAEILLMLRTIGPDSRPHTFVCSFSTAQKGDDLSQWRAYCPEGGYAIGLPRARMAEFLGSEFILQKCRYDKKYSDVYIKTIAKKAGEFIRSGRPRDIVTSANAMLCRLALTYKDPSFRAEVEWRLISTGLVKLPVKYRTRGNLLIPYIALSLVDVALWEDVHIVVGPCSRQDAELRRESVKMFLQSELPLHGLPTTCIKNVRLSSIPYRTGIGG